MARGDDDVDICVTLDDHQTVTDIFAQINSNTTCAYVTTQNKNHHLCGYFNGKAIKLYQVRPISADDTALLHVFFFREEGDGTLRCMWSSSEHARVDNIFPTRKWYVPRWGFSVNVPNQATKRLSEKRGDFRTRKDKDNGLMNRLSRASLIFVRCETNLLKGASSAALLLVAFITTMPRLIFVVRGKIE